MDIRVVRSNVFTKFKSEGNSYEGCLYGKEQQVSLFEAIEVMPSAYSWKSVAKEEENKYL